MVLDPKALDNLLELVGGDQEALIELIDTFLGEAPQLLARMRDAVESRDAATLRLTSHSLKSNAIDLGALTFADLCKRLETLGREGTVAGAPTLVAQIETEYQRVESALIAFRDT